MARISLEKNYENRRSVGGFTFEPPSPAGLQRLGDPPPRLPRCYSRLVEFISSAKCVSLLSKNNNISK